MIILGGVKSKWTGVVGSGKAKVEGAIVGIFYVSEMMGRIRRDGLIL